MLSLSAMSSIILGEDPACPKPDAFEGCTTILAGRKATADGSVLMAHNEDMGTVSGRLMFIPHATHVDLSVYMNYVTLPQARETFAYWGSGNSSAVADSLYDGGWILCGMNAFGVSMGCNTVFTREERIPRGEGIMRYSIRRLILERSRSARDAVGSIGWLIDTFGQSDSPVAYCVADRDEAWLVETTYRHWAARRIPDDGFHVIANQYTIESEWDMASRDLVAYAAGQGWYDPADGPFSFKSAYGDPERLDHPRNTDREQQGKRMLENKIGSITVEHLLSVLSEPPIQTTGTQAFMIWHLRKHLPRDIGCVMWHGMGGANTSVAVPVYLGGSKIPEAYTDASFSEDFESAWWQFERIQKRLYPSIGKYAHGYPDVRKALDAFQDDVFEEQRELEAKFMLVWERGRLEEAKDLTSHFTFQKLNDALQISNDALISFE